MTPLVFLPGAVGSAAFWRPVADRLTDLGPVHVLGYPGFGGLPADPGIESLDDLFGWFVERLPTGASHVIAQSMGGVLAARLALEQPERVARLVLVATSGGVDVSRLGGAEWRHEYRASLPDVPTWFIDDRTDLPSPAGLYLGNAAAALVYDSSFMGATGPILGQSYRFQISPTFGSLNYYTLLADFRKYIMPVKPFTLAARFMHYSRNGKGADDERLWPMFIGYDWYIRGYNYNSFEDDYYSFDMNRLFGSKLMLLNLELRFPLFGALGIGKGFYGIFPVDFIAFYDMGLAWDSTSKPWFLSGGDRKPLRSAGVGLRVNVFGYAVLGLNYVKPFDRPDKGAYWQFSFYPGF